jgi:hypothetical protein
MPGQNGECPQVQGKLSYEKDLWGKAAFYGRPRGFVAQVTAGWQRTQYRGGGILGAAGYGGAFDGLTLYTFGVNNFNLSAPAAACYQHQTQYLNPWMLQGTLFIPVIPTYSNNLAGTASLSGQWFIGQGVSAFGEGRDNDNSYFKFDGIGFGGMFYYNRYLMNQTGGYIQAQYYFTNQWFLNVCYGQILDYGIPRNGNAFLASAAHATNPTGCVYASTEDQQKLWNEVDVTLYYRPIEALKFGLAYAYERSLYEQKVNNPSYPAVAGGQVWNNPKDTGQSHRIEFVAYMFF